MLRVGLYARVSTEDQQTLPMQTRDPGAAAAGPASGALLLRQSLRCPSGGCRGPGKFNLFDGVLHADFPLFRGIVALGL